MQDSSTQATLRDFDSAKPLPLATRRLRPPRHVAGEQGDASKESLKNIILGDYRELDLIFEPTNRILWCYMQPEGPPSFTPGMMRELNCVHEAIPNEEFGLRYCVIGSRLPGVFNLGGDLAYLMSCILAADKKALTLYAHRCVDAAFACHSSFGGSVVSIGLVQGAALGGGFESSLSMNILVAERSAKMGFPEVLFGLFPGMGAYSFLSRKIGRSAAHNMISTGKVYSAVDLHDMGLIDILCPDGEGEVAVRKYIAENNRRHGQILAINKARQRVDPISYSELIDVTDIWVNAALKLDAIDLRRMQRLVRAQISRQ